jgi:hypothetical protein
MSSLLQACLILGSYSAWAAGLRFIAKRNLQPLGMSNAPAFRFPLATLLLAGAIAVPSTLQFFFPAILSDFERDYARAHLER